MDGGFGYSQVGGFGDSPATPAKARAAANVYIPVDIAAINNVPHSSTINHVSRGLTQPRLTGRDRDE